MNLTQHSKLTLWLGLAASLATIISTIYLFWPSKADNGISQNIKDGIGANIAKTENSTVDVKIKK